MYALLGPSRVLVLGPDSSVSPLIFAAITPLLVANDTASAIAMAGMLALMVGLIEIGLGLGKLGFIADLLSKEVQVGYMNGLAITIIVGQLPKLFGFSTDADTFVDDVVAFFPNLDQTNTTTLLVGLGTLALLLGLPHVSKKIPAVLVAVVAATVVSAAFDLAAEGVKTVGTLPSGLPTPSIPWTSASDLATLAAAAVGIVLVSLTDTIATSSSFAARRGDEVDADREMIAVGASNVGAGLFQGFAISVSGSRTAVAEQSGSKTQVTGLVGAGLVDRHARLHARACSRTCRRRRWPPSSSWRPSRWRTSPSCAASRTSRKTALFLSLVATAGVVFFGVLQGILIAAILSILLFFRRSWWPPGAVLGYVPEKKGYHDVERYPDGRADGGHRHLPVGGAAVLRQRRHLPAAGPQAGGGAPAALDRAPVRGHHRHRRHRRRHAQAARHGAQRARASTSRSSSCATGCRTGSGSTGCGRRWTGSTSSPR